LVLEKKIFKWPHPIFVIISPLKRTWPFIWTNLNPLHSRIICVKCDVSFAGSGEEDFKKLSVYFYSFAIISPWRRVYPFILTNLNPYPPPPDDLCQIWQKLAHWFWRRSRKCKSLRTDRWTDRWTIRKAHLSFQLRWAKNS
jgi:hypothetical protein